tara:strand:+ start:699 stop:1394 length:696 start_codon:yes stop_codon:yes gene_type:complete
MHVGLIMDGNGRWATRRGFGRIEGHKTGAKVAEEIIRACSQVDVKTLTLYAFSTENWLRANDEIKGLMDLFDYYISRNLTEMISNGIKIQFLGSKAGLPGRIVDLIYDATEKTKHNTKFFLNIAINYGGRDEIVRAVRKIAKNVKNGLTNVDDIDEKTIASMLDTSSQRDPDLIIRTAGEQRLSNFLSWQSAYSEFYFSGLEWPEFNKAEFFKALESYKSRVRSFGAVAGE